MGSARQDYERFLRWLHEPERQAPESGRRFANLVLANFDAVAATARQHNNRSHLLARLAREGLAQTSADLPPLREPAPQGTWPWVRLRHLTLGPFRGFRESQGFDLSRRLVLCYGPNGSGKSSFCEALEYALRGSVEEAAAKRIDHARYLANIHAGRFVEPTLVGTDSQGNEVQVRSDEDAFRFFFVEQNRIDNFSRIAASTPGRKTDLIATLFGMDQFNDFAAHFNESMDAALTLESTQQLALSGRRQALRADETASDAEANKLRAEDQAAADYAAAYQDGLTLEGLCGLVGSDEAPGRLQELDAKLRAVPPAITSITREGLARAYAHADAEAESVSRATRNLHARRDQVSFRDLFAAVQRLRDDHPDRCPACLTRLEQVMSNPFDRADAGLRELQEIAALEADVQRISEAAAETSRTLRTELRKIEAFLQSVEEADSLVGTYVRGLPEVPNTLDWWKAIHTPDANEGGATPSLEQILEVADRAAGQDIVVRQAIEARNADATEQRRLNDARVWIAEYRTRRDRIVQDATQARERIAQWEAVNADLIRRAELEGPANLRDGPIKQAYDSFHQHLEQFRDRLPGMLMADLNATAMELYNEFNHMDRDEDKLAELLLPLTAESVIEIAFRGNPGRRINALTALSEGHIRCLGLAILLAKAQSVRVPLIIFDDAVNAIDHDHRGGIRAAIFESNRFRETQIIVTCHSQEFVKDVENSLPRNLRGDCQQYALRHHDGNHQPRVNPDVGSANYLARAQQAMDRHDCRDALSFARKALEMFMHKAWKWMESHRVGNISVQIEGPTREPQLRALCEAVRTRLGGLNTFNHASKNTLLQCLNTILGIPEQNLVWLLLNKGTHEEPDRDDFDVQHVEMVLRVLGDIDGIELRAGR